MLINLLVNPPATPPCRDRQDSVLRVKLGDLAPLFYPVASSLVWQRLAACHSRC